MAGSYEPGALLGHIYTLRDGSLVRLRLARSSDAAALKELLEGRGAGPSDLELSRLVHFDPRRRYVLCATGLIESTETLLGVGVIDLDESAGPELLVVRDGLSPELRDLLEHALRSAGRALSRSRAA